MRINKKQEILFSNHSSFESEKTQILLAHTYRPKEEYFAQLSARKNGSYDRSPHFTIDKTGKVYQHFDPKYCSFFLSFAAQVDKSLISIALENNGLITKDIKSGKFYDWLGREYKGEVVEKLWKDHSYWIPYTEKQKESVAKLIDKLTTEFNIPKQYIGSNVKLEKAKDFKGVVSRSNYFAEYTDINPTFDVGQYLKT